MRHVEVRELRRRFAAGSALLLAAVMLVAGLAVLAGQQASAQSTGSENPHVYQRPLINGAVVDEFVIEAIGPGNYTQVELYMGAASDRANRVTYQDYGSVQLWLEQRPGGGLSNGRDLFYSVGSDGMTGAQLTLCAGGAGHRCQISKAEWKQLAGQTGVTAEQEATTEVDSIQVAFNLPSSVTAATIRLGVVHYSQDATRRGSGSRWGPSVDWARKVYGANVAAVDDQGRPFWVRNSLSQSTSGRDLQHPFAAGQLTQVEASIGLGSRSGSITYAQFTSVALTLEDAASSSALNSNSGAHRELFRTRTGDPLPACADNASDNSCIITKAEWQALAGQAGAAESDAVGPIRIAIKPPREFPAGTDYTGDKMTLAAVLTATGVDVQNRSATFQRMSAHISRLQSGQRGVGAVDPASNDGVADDQHIGTSCMQAVHITGGSAPTMDCNRAVEVGEGVYLENILRLGNTNANDGSTPSTGALPNTGDSWLRADAARAGVFYDRIEVAATVGGNPGGGIVAVSTLCPIDAPADPPHPDAMVISPRDRTVAGMAKCVYGDPRKSGTYWGGSGPTFIPTVSSGVVTVTLSYHKGADDPSTSNIDESLVAKDTLGIPVTAATDNTDTGNGGSDWDESALIAELGSRSYDSSLSLLIGHRRNRGIPEFWRGALSPTGPGSVAGATYASVDASEAVALTVPARGGTLELLGTDKSCSAGEAACTLTITRADLKAAARYGVPAASISGSIEDAAPYWPAELRFTHASPAENVTISGVLKRADGSTHEFSHVAKGSSVAHGAAVAAYLPADADSRLAPDQTTALAVGYRVPETSSGSDSWRAFNPTPEFYGIESYSGNVGVIAATDTPARALPSAADGTYLRLSGPATWALNGGQRLRLDRDGYGYFKCVATKTLTRVPTDEGRICYVSDADGNAPEVTAADDAAADITVTASLPLWTLFGDEEPGQSRPGSGGGYFRAITVTETVNGAPVVVNTHHRQRLEVFGAANVDVETVSQLSSIALGRTPAADGSVPTSPIRIGGSGEVRLSLLNENNQPSQISAVSAITITVIGGGTLSGFGCTELSSCTIEGDSGALFEAAKTTPGVTGAIDLTYKAPNTPGEASIEATVVGTDGMTFPERLVLTVSGSATEIASSGEMPRVHSSATEGDDRDKVLIPITARDANGNAARMPTNAAATVRGIDGASLPAGSHTATVKCEGGDDEPRLKCNVEVIVTASPGSPLASGAYTATVTGSGIGSTEVGFAAAGPAETVNLSIPDDLPGVGQPFSASVSVVDKAGIPVADGTWVAFETTGTSGAGAKTAILGSPPEADVDHDGDDDTPTVRQRRTKTKNGEAGATVIVVGNGIAVLTATAGGKTANEPIDTRVTAIEAPVDGPKLRFETPDETAATGTLATWTSTGAGDAREALEQVSDASVVWLWNGVEWIRWGMTADGTPIPGSSATPFVILAGDRIWFAD